MGKRKVKQLTFTYKPGKVKQFTEQEINETKINIYNFLIEKVMKSKTSFSQIEINKGDIV